MNVLPGVKLVKFKVNEVAPSRPAAVFGVEPEKPVADPPVKGVRSNHVRYPGPPDAGSKNSPGARLIVTEVRLGPVGPSANEIANVPLAPPRKFMLPDTGIEAAKSVEHTLSAAKYTRDFTEILTQLLQTKWDEPR